MAVNSMQRKSNNICTLIAKVLITLIVTGTVIEVFNNENE